jgi:hypothetical protein
MTKSHLHKYIRICRWANAIIFIMLALYFLLLPGIIIVWNFRDPGLNGEGIPRIAFRCHKSLSPKYEKWAQSRVESGIAGKLTTSQIAQTEWPLFGSVFYLWATESLQEAWEKHNSMSQAAPKEYAKGAIEAAAALIADPNHAAWVKQHWGEDYLKKQNLFYRELLIAGFTSYQKLTDDKKYETLLREQIESLSKEIDESSCGLLEDYPDECYPTDVLGAIAAIKRADIILGTDHSEFIKRSLRAFQGQLLDENGLPPYSAGADSGIFAHPARGCGLSFMLIYAPELWQETAKDWYARYEKFYWQTGWSAGFREFPNNGSYPDWYADVDAGPVIAGYGTASSAFGVGAARANGRFDHAYPLCAEMLVASWPLIDGTLLMPRILSNATDAPYLGEAGVLFALTRTPVGGMEIVKGGLIPRIVYVFLVIYIGVGFLLILGQLLALRRWRRREPQSYIPITSIQIVIWLVITLTGIVLIFTYSLAYGILLLFIAQLLPRMRRIKI